MMDINMDLLQWFINFLIKKSSGGEIKNEIMSNKELAEELHKPFIRKFEKRKVHSSFIDNVWSTDLKDLNLYYVLLIVIASTHGLFLYKIKK